MVGERLLVWLKGRRFWGRPPNGGFRSVRDRRSGRWLEGGFQHGRFVNEVSLVYLYLGLWYLWFSQWLIKSFDVYPSHRMRTWSFSFSFDRLPLPFRGGLPLCCPFFVVPWFCRLYLLLRSPFKPWHRSALSVVDSWKLDLSWRKAFLSVSTIHRWLPPYRLFSPNLRRCPFWKGSRRPEPRSLRLPFLLPRGLPLWSLPSPEPVPLAKNWLHWTRRSRFLNLLGLLRLSRWTLVGRFEGLRLLSHRAETLMVNRFAYSSDVSLPVKRDVSRVPRSHLRPTPCPSSPSRTRCGHLSGETGRDPFVN